MLVRESWHESHDGAATRGNGVIGNSRRGHPKKPMRRGIDDITPCSLPPTGERNSYHNGCSETGQGVEQRLPSSSSSKNRTKVNVPPRGDQSRRDTGNDKRETSLPGLDFKKTMVKIERRRGGRRGECGGRLRCHESHHRSTWRSNPRSAPSGAPAMTGA